ncbi:YdaU family protein [Chromobacterium subtsugae]|uniref:YdaU family protein n=1 Tax=Chromobacterium subtsugae TaxID=251747 RepID=UPI00069C4E5D|nr:YdaU family protein [Chromobacterium subtsugae]
MNFYKRFMGDYARATAHLSLAEHGAYSLLLDHYYSTEKGLPADMVALIRICRAFSPEEQAAVQSVVDQFFPAGDDGTRHNSRADEQIAEDVARIETARENGKRGGRRKQTQHEPKQNPSGLPKEPSGLARPEPDGNQGLTQPASTPQPEPELTQEPNGSLVSDARRDRGGIPVPEDLQPCPAARLSAGQLSLNVWTERDRFVAHFQGQSATRRDVQAWQAQFRKWLLDAHQINADRERITQSRMQASQSNTGNRQAAMSSMYNPPRRDMPAEREIQGETIHEQ